MSKFRKHQFWLVTVCLTFPMWVDAQTQALNTFAANTVISSKAVNDNFSSLNTRITALEGRSAGAFGSNAQFMPPFTALPGTVTLNHNGTCLVVATVQDLLQTAVGPSDPGASMAPVYTNASGATVTCPTLGPGIAGPFYLMPAAGTGQFGPSYYNTLTCIAPVTANVATSFGCAVTLPSTGPFASGQNSATCQVSWFCL